MHNTHNPRSGSTRDLTQWWTRYQRISAIAERLGRLPRLSDGVDPSDANWPARQRRATTLNENQRNALESLPGWSDQPRTDAWEARAEDLRQFIASNDRAPQTRGALHGEAALAHWLSRQRIAERNGSLGIDRSTALRYATRHLD